MVASGALRQTFDNVATCMRQARSEINFSNVPRYFAAAGFLRVVSAQFTLPFVYSATFLPSFLGKTGQRGPSPY